MDFPKIFENQVIDHGPPSRQIPDLMSADALYNTQQIYDNVHDAYDLFDGCIIRDPVLF